MTEKGEEFRRRLREGVQGNDSIRPSYNPHQNIKYTKEYQMGEVSRNDLAQKYPDEIRPTGSYYQSIKNNKKEDR